MSSTTASSPWNANATDKTRNVTVDNHGGSYEIALGINDFCNQDFIAKIQGGETIAISLLRQSQAAFPPPRVTGMRMTLMESRMEMQPKEIFVSCLAMPIKLPDIYNLLFIYSIIRLDRQRAVYGAVCQPKRHKQCYEFTG